MPWMPFVFPIVWMSLGALLLTHLAESWRPRRGDKTLWLLGVAGLWMLSGKVVAALLV